MTSVVNFKAHPLYNHSRRTLYILKRSSERPPRCARGDISAPRPHGCKCSVLNHPEDYQYTLDIDHGFKLVSQWSIMWAACISCVSDGECQKKNVNKLRFKRL